MDKIKVGVIGIGGISQLMHIPVLAKHKEVEISGIVDINKNILNNVSERFSIKNTYSDYREMLEKSGSDAVMIATPTKFHHEMALASIDAGKHLFIEKPIARTLEEAKEIAKAAEKKGVKVMVGMNMRYRPDIMLLKSIINSGDLGSPFYVKAGWLRKQSSTGKWFTKKIEAGGGVIFDLGIVLLDLSLWMLDFPDILSVSTQNYYINTRNVEDSSISFIKAQPDSLVYLESSWSLQSGDDTFYLDIQCEKGNAFLNPLRISKNLSGNQIDLAYSKQENPRKLFEKSYVNEINHFIGAIKGLNPVLSSAKDAVSRMGIIEAMYLSASIKSEIKF